MRIRKVNALVLGSGAAGLTAAVRLDCEGVKNILVVSEGLDKGTSINTGSDKQTYYKLSLCGGAEDSPRAMAETYMSAGSTDGDTALVEAAYSTRAFFNLVDLGVPFPRDAFGQFAGYKTDHDPAKRATSCGPYTSREMCRALIRELKRRNIEIWEDFTALKLVTVDLEPKEGVAQKRVVGLVGAASDGEPYFICAKHIVFAVGGPGGLYKASVYPEVHTGAIGLALMEGAVAKALPESQFGLASFTDITEREIRVETNSRPEEFRWNVSGTFMQVVPKFISTAADGVSESREFLRDYFDDLGDLFGRVFLKGYQWPFDARKAIDGSSFIDLCVYYETTINGRRVFLDYREDPEDFAFEKLPEEALEYLTRSEALLQTPIERLRKMNPNAIEMYRDWGIDLAAEPLEIAVCAQHNNGGLAVDAYWRSINIEGLYPIGEVAGTHGVARPGGSALNAGQVGAYRAAERIAFECRGVEELETESFTLNEFIGRKNFDLKELQGICQAVADVVGMARQMKADKIDWRAEREEIRERMSVSAGIFRSTEYLYDATASSRSQLRRLATPGEVSNSYDDTFRFDRDDVESLRDLQLCIAQISYLDAILIQVLSRVGSRGSAVVLSSKGKRISEKLPEEWKIQDENPNFRDKILYSYLSKIDLGIEEAAVTESFWKPVKPIPEPNDWFENVWRDFREDKIYE